MAGEAAPRGGRRLAEKGDGVSARHGGPRPVWATVPGLRDRRTTHRVRGERDELLPALPDQRQGAGRPFAVAATARRLAAVGRGAGGGAGEALTRGGGPR